MGIEWQPTGYANVRVKDMVVPRVELTQGEYGWCVDAHYGDMRIVFGDCEGLTESQSKRVAQHTLDFIAAYRDYREATKTLPTTDDLMLAKEV